MMMQDLGFTNAVKQRSCSGREGDSLVERVARGDVVVHC